MTLCYSPATGSVARKRMSMERYGVFKGFPNGSRLWVGPADDLNEGKAKMLDSARRTGLEHFVYNSSLSKPSHRVRKTARPLAAPLSRRSRLFQSSWGTSAMFVRPQPHFFSLPSSSLVMMRGRHRTSQGFEGGTRVMPKTTTFRLLGKVTLCTSLLLSRLKEYA